MKNLLPKIKFATFISVAFVAFIIVSCNQVRKDFSEQPDVPVPFIDQVQNLAEEVKVPIIETTEAETEQQSLEKIAETNTVVLLNPPHGEPGHSCEIPVGAPLNSVPSEVAEQTTTNNSSPAPAVVNTGSRLGPTVENAKLKSSQTFSIMPANNPPHGEPWHRCDIPVGAPLTASSTNGIRINPPHGQPGHRCDIPVGDPLPS